MLIFETKNFFITTPDKPELSRKDGGQVDIEEKHRLPDRLLLCPEAEAELTFLTHLVATAFKKIMIKNGINIVRFNYQDNGNWAYFTDGVPSPKMHLHIYGRVFDSEKEALPNSLVFPNPITEKEFYDNEPLTDKDISDLKNEILLLLTTDEFDYKRWYLKRNPFLN